MSDMCFDDFDYDRMRCPVCGCKWDESEDGPDCPECYGGAYLLNIYPILEAIQ